MLTKDAEFRRGDAITIFIKNRPYIDFEVPPDLNDFRDADYTEVKIYNPEEELILQSPLRKAGEHGWYYYRFQTSYDSMEGLYKVVVKLTTEIPVGEFTDTLSAGTTGTTGVGTTGTTGTTGVGTTGTTGDNDYPEMETEFISDVQIRYFRLSSKEVF